MLTRLFLTATACCLPLIFANSAQANSAQANSITTKQRIYQNETAIEFVSNKGETTDAFQGFIEVKENRNKPNSRNIKVHYVRFPATGKTSGAPIVYLAGGPGVSGIATAKWRRFPIFMALREFGDVIALDQRGTGLSETAPKCVSSQQLPLTERHLDSTVAEKYQLAASECHRFWQDNGYDVLGYTTVQNALDLDDLRRHLNATKISLWGISYGSHLALAAMKVMENRLDKVLLASAEGLNQTVKLPERTDSYFSMVQAVIDQQPDLAARFPDIKQLMRQVHQQLDDSPILVQVPQKQGAAKPMLFQKHHMQALASMTIADPGQYLSLLLNLYSQLAQGDSEGLTQVLKRGMFNEESISFRLMPFAMDIASGITDKRLTQVKQQSKQALLGEILNFPMPMLNKAIEGLDLGDEFRKAPSSQIPTLLFTGSLDGRTYSKGQQAAVRGLSQLTHVMVENAGHNLFTASPEVLEIMGQFLQERKITKQTIQLPLPKL